MSSGALESGSLFVDRYRIQRILGSGGFATVYLATEEALGRRVALKVLRPWGSSTVMPSAEARERFFKRFGREARVIARLSAPETVTLYEYGSTDDGLAYMALEYVEGSNLWEIVEAEGPLGPERVEKIVRGVLRSLREAYEMGLQHRDLKPANIMVYGHLGERDLVKLLDFGVVKITRDVGVSYSSLTGEGNVVGTPNYMAPEYVAEDIVSPQGDLYALGLVAYELLTGEKGVDGETAIEVMSAHVRKESLKLPEELEIPERLRAVVDGLMEKDRRRRFASAEEVLALLDRDSLDDTASLAATVESSQVIRNAAARAAAAVGSPEPEVHRVQREVRESREAKQAAQDESLRRRTRSHRGTPMLEAKKVETGTTTGGSGRDSNRWVLPATIVLGLLVGALIWWFVRGV